MSLRALVAPTMLMVISANQVVDTDGNGTPNHLDLDSDGDGQSDLIEVGGNDLNNDGIVDAWTDSDGDGIVDAVDVDNTNGIDADGDGIDDFADADYVDAVDSDGDGIIDVFDDEYLGTGFLPFIVSAEAVSYENIPDVDGDGVPDLLEENTTESEPEPGPATPGTAGPTPPAGPEPAEAEKSNTVYAGIKGSGCSLSSSATSSDPLLPATTFIAGLILLLRRMRSPR